MAIQMRHHQGRTADSGDLLLPRASTRRNRRRTESQVFRPEPHGFIHVGYGKTGVIESGYQIALLSALMVRA
jgi:hypothetical protein